MLAAVLLRYLAVKGGTQRRTKLEAVMGCMARFWGGEMPLHYQESAFSVVLQPASGGDVSLT